MMDWRTIPKNTGLGLSQLNQIIAKRLGWKVVDLNDNPSGARVKGPNWALLNPEGKTIGYDFTEDRVWDEGLRFVQDLNEAYKLFDPLPAYYTIELTGLWPRDKWYARLRSCEGAGDITLVETEIYHIAALAVACAWLAWDDVKTSK